MVLRRNTDFTREETQPSRERINMALRRNTDFTREKKHGVETKHALLIRTSRDS
jgi:hypothetical protein